MVRYPLAADRGRCRTSFSANDAANNANSHTANDTTTTSSSRHEVGCFDFQVPWVEVEAGFSCLDAAPKTGNLSL
jgi:hypothetical protein